MVSPKICVPITARSPSQAVDIIRSVQPYGPDLLELRLDYMDSPGNLQRVRDVTDLPLIATNRSRDQGGLSSSPEADRLAILLKACDVGFNYVDLELTTDSINDVAEEVKAHGARLIISYHDFNGTPPFKDLNKIMHEELSLGADVCKIVGTSKSLHDSLTYLNFLDANTDGKLVCFGMGEHGVISRVLSPLFGGMFTFASVRAGLESAPGQLTIADLKEVYRLLGV